MGKRQRKRLREAKKAKVADFVMEVPFDSAKWVKEFEPTYGGEPMPDVLPTREQYIESALARDASKPDQATS